MKNVTYFVLLCLLLACGESPENVTSKKQKSSEIVVEVDTVVEVKKEKVFSVSAPFLSNGTMKDTTVSVVLEMNEHDFKVNYSIIVDADSNRQVIDTNFLKQISTIETNLVTVAMEVRAADTGELVWETSFAASRIIGEYTYPAFDHESGAEIERPKIFNNAFYKDWFHTSSAVEVLSNVISVKTEYHKVNEGMIDNDEYWILTRDYNINTGELEERLEILSNFN